MSDLIKRLENGQTFHCPDCGFGFPVQDPTAAQALREKDKEIGLLQDEMTELTSILLDNDAEIARLRDELDRLCTMIEEPSWHDYIHITKNWLKFYPPDIFTGESGDKGPLFVVAVRKALAALETE